MNNIKYKHLHKGGTMITNFPMCESNKYKKAVMIYNNGKAPINQLYVENRAYYGDNILLFDGGSLHAVNRITWGKSLTAFWKIFDSL